MADEKPKPKIFIICERLHTGSGAVQDSTPGGDVVGYALAEDGAGLGSHLSSNVEFCKHDRGLTSNWKHQYYDQYYPEGYELVDLTMHDGDEALMTVPEYMAALRKNQEAAGITIV